MATETKKVRSKVTLGGELMFPNEYLSSPELKGADATVTIASVIKEDLQLKTGGKQAKMVMRFVGTKKKLVVNKTNADSIAALYGSEAEKWVNKRITLYPTRCLAFGETVECIRVREKAPAPSKTATPPPPPPPEPTEGVQDEPDSFGSEMNDLMKQ